MGLHAIQAQADDLQSLLEAHVKKEHGDSLSLFVVADWLEEMKGADLQSKKKSLCMLSRDAFTAYMAIVKQKQAQQPPKAQLEDAKEQVTFDLILSTPAPGHRCKNAKVAELGRIL
jgi:hypothetical protein